MHQRPYEKLIVWQEAHLLCLWVHKRTASFPADERYGITSQIRRASSSVPTNIAEGNSRHTRKDKMHFFVIAHASLEEVHYHARLAKDLAYLNEEEFIFVDRSIQRISYLLMRLRNHSNSYQNSLES